MSSVRRLCTIFRPHLHKCNPFHRQRYRQYSTKGNSVVTQPTPPPFNHKKWALVFSFAAVSTLNEDEKKKKQEVSCCSGHKDDRKENIAPTTIEIDPNEIRENADPAFTSFEHEVEDFGQLKWEKLYNDHRCTVHRRWLPDLDTYEYRCCGTYDDISAQDFVDAQMDDNYRKKWDPHVIELEVIESVDETIDIVRWLHRFPRPLNPRVYIYRREKRWSKSGIYTIESKVLTEEEHPTSEADKYSVRVETYSSTLRVRPHKEYENQGFDYVLIYYDHPKAVIPGPAYNWMVSKGGPYFLNYVHDAAKKLREERSSV